MIASQAVISGAFSLTRQAIQMGYCPRLTITHTSNRQIGQIYVPFINWTLLAAVMLLVAGFRTSSNLAAAYGIAVTLAMLIDSLLIYVVLTRLWRLEPRWPRFASPIPLLCDRHGVPRVERAEDPRWRLVPDRHRRRRLHVAHHLEARAIDTACPTGRGDDADRRLRRIHSGRAACARSRHRGIPHQHPRPGSARAVAQPEAQQGAARARGAADA